MAAQKLTITLSDGKTITVQPTLEDRLKFEATLRKNRSWGDLKDNTLKLQPFLAWSAARRTNAFTLTWDEFTSGDTAALDVESASDEADEADEAELEVPGVGKGSKRAASTTSR